MLRKLYLCILLSGGALEGLLEAYRLIGFKFKRDSPHARQLTVAKLNGPNFFATLRRKYRLLKARLTPGLHRSIRINDAITARISVLPTAYIDRKATFWPVILTKKEPRYRYCRSPPSSNSIVDYYVFPKDAGLRRQFCAFTNGIIRHRLISFKWLH